MTVVKLNTLKVLCKGRFAGTVKGSHIHVIIGGRQVTHCRRRNVSFGKRPYSFRCISRGSTDLRPTSLIVLTMGKARLSSTVRATHGRINPSAAVVSILGNVSDRRIVNTTFNNRGVIRYMTRKVSTLHANGSIGSIRVNRLHVNVSTPRGRAHLSTITTFFRRANLPRIIRTSVLRHV